MIHHKLITLTRTRGKVEIEKNEKGGLGLQKWDGCRSPFNRNGV